MTDKEVLPIMNPLLGMHLIPAEVMLGVRYVDSVPNSDQLNRNQKIKEVRAKWDMVNKIKNMGIEVEIKDYKLFGL